ncbi:DEAD-box ATP-dependent RNA helicase FANCM [Citrus sinensis]|uniref:DEAD-box ATP-dependent RNA helicase FANCM n=1 Tax=Citrus sinensis TaxID=2711 RepID=A0ACB8KU59_CITSI|nr:DEAD-box ATP-dependent RNA helicase FANCM [Citrus sinensis]
MAANKIPIEINGDDDDEFDWEAAVREIDTACQSSKPSTSNSTNFNLCSKANKKPSTCKQSTLDKFFGNLGPKPQGAEEFNEGSSFDESLCHVQIDAEAAKTWIYPVNVPVRDYQFAITKTALFSNTLVALPTGLGKTLIAAVVIYNFFRWFPDGKIVFAAPSRPLVMQQIEACHNIVGIPQEWTIDMTGQISPTKRASFWKTKRVFFVTPQVLEKDIQSGTCLMKYLVCLVIDEAHRATGNYAYCTAIRELMSVPVQLRILALTATPGSKQQTIQHIIDNLYISTLEYRNESDQDVSSYVHNRKIELIEVEMGQEAVEINNRIWEVIRPYTSRLSAIGLLQNRDYQTLSPVDLLNSRDKFRQAPPPNLPQIKFGEVEAYFGALITLYHIRRLLSSHGIRPAYEMLEEKLKQGSFARFMSKNEDIRKVKLLMQQSISHGAQSPKLSKMLEVLVDHFMKTSLVIVLPFRDIMNALATIGDLVKATEFIGQSSGKASKGQSQKVQQAVLEKFRAGGYNVIVATSIGEEGLDIMEVDLVICFDANVSPLRMIQRMGRTGRKHDGRIPHIFKPEVQFVELSIEQYVSRGKKVKDDHAITTPIFKEKLTAAETDLIAKYFHPTSDSTWRPSLIAFPHFQALPSRVHKVMHSFRTGMLIDMMQHLQGLTFSGDDRTFVEDEVSSDKHLGLQTVEPCETDERDNFHGTKKVTDSELSTRTLGTQEKHSMPQSCCKSPAAHAYLFYSDFISVDALGKVLIISVPALPFKELSHSKKKRAPDTLLLNHWKQDSSPLKTSDKNYDELTVQSKAVEELTTSQAACIKDGALPISRFCRSDALPEKPLDGFEEILDSPVLRRNQLREEDTTDETLDVNEIKEPLSPDDEYHNDLRDSELSPRLTNLIKSGVVPESPINENGASNNKGRNPDLASPVKLCSIQPSKFASLGKTEKCSKYVRASQGNVSISPVNKKIQTPLLKMNHTASAGGYSPTSPIAEETKTPLANLANSSCSRDWRLSSGDKSENVEPARKFKRLRKVRDCEQNKNSENMKENAVAPVVNLARRFLGMSPIQNKHGRGRKKPMDNMREYIEEEAEVSSEAEVSDDEEDDEDNNSYDDSFIDDRMNPTATSTQAESSGVDMMAIYRRSLLSQSPVVRQPNFSLTYSPDSATPMTRITGSGSSSGKTLISMQTPHSKSANRSTCRNSESIQTIQQQTTSATFTSTDLIRERERNLENRKRKLSYYHSGSTPAINLEPKFSFHSEDTGKNLCQQGQGDNIKANGETIDDDQFYENLDLDAVEEHAALLLKQKSEFSVREQEVIPQSQLQKHDIHCSPSFDLGI